MKKENLKGHSERVHPKRFGFLAEPKAIVVPRAVFKSHGRRNVLVLSLVVLAVIGVSIVSAQLIDASTMKTHVHPQLSATINGDPRTIPANVGTPSGPWADHSLDQYGMTRMSPLHTHDASGRVHVESNKVRDFTLREFLAVWGARVDANQVLDHSVDSGHRAYLVVDGVERQITDTVVFSDGQEIKIVCGL